MSRNRFINYTLFSLYTNINVAITTFEEAKQTDIQNERLPPSKPHQKACDPVASNKHNMDNMDTKLEDHEPIVSTPAKDARSQKKDKAAPL